MKNNEYYKSNEYNNVSEFLSNNQEFGSNSSEINNLGEEHFDTGREYTFINNSKLKKYKTKNITEIIKKMITTASTGTVAAIATIVIIVSVLVKTPIIELVDLDYEQEKIYYTLLLKETNDGEIYYLSVESDSLIYQKQLSEGDNSDVIKGVVEGIEYKLIVFSNNILGEKTIHLETTIGIKATVLNIEQVVGINSVTFNVELTNHKENKKYYLEINNQNYELKEGSNNITVDLLKPSTTYNYQIIELGTEQKIIHTDSITTLDEIIPEVIIEKQINVGKSSADFEITLSNGLVDKSYTFTINGKIYEIVEGLNIIHIDNLMSNTSYNYQIFENDQVIESGTITTTKEAEVEENIISDATFVTFEIELNNKNEGSKYYLYTNGNKYELNNGVNNIDIRNLTPDTVYTYQILEISNSEVILKEGVYSTIKLLTVEEQKKVDSDSVEFLITLTNTNKDNKYYLEVNDMRYVLKEGTNEVFISNLIPNQTYSYKIVENKTIDENILKQSSFITTKELVVNSAYIVDVTYATFDITLTNINLDNTYHLDINGFLYELLEGNNSFVVDNLKANTQYPYQIVERTSEEDIILQEGSLVTLKELIIEDTNIIDIKEINFTINLTNTDVRKFYHFIINAKQYQLQSGTNNIVVNDLMPNTSYTYQIIEVFNNVEKTLKESSVQTLKEVEVVETYIAYDEEIEFKINLTNSILNREYKLLINSNEYILQEGLNEITIANLNVETNYIYQIVEIKENTTRIIKESSVQTLKEVEVVDIVTSSVNELVFSINLTNTLTNYTYKLVVNNFEYQLQSGDNNIVVNDLMPNTSYTYQIIEVFNNVEKTLKESSVQTLVEPVPDSYDGTYLFPSEDQIKVESLITDGEQLTFNYTHNPSDASIFKYKITVSSNGVILDEFFPNASNDEQTYSLLLDNSITNFEIKCEVYGELNGNSKTYDTFVTNIDLTLPSFAFGDSIEFISTRVYRVSYYITTTNPQRDIFTNINLKINYPADYNNMVEEITISDLTINQTGYIDIELVDSSVFNVTFEATLNYQASYSTIVETRLVTKQHYFDNIIAVKELSIDNQEIKIIQLEFDNHIIYPNRIVIVDADTGDEYPLDGDIAYIEAPIDKTYNFKYYISDDGGNIISSEYEYSVTVETITGEFAMEYPNGTDYIVTTNADGSINISATTNFSTDDPDIYYEVVLYGDTQTIKYTSTSPTFTTNNIENEMYYIDYNVYKTVNGVKYILYTSYASDPINNN